MLLVRGKFGFLYVVIWFDVTKCKFYCEKQQFKTLAVFSPILWRILGTRPYSSNVFSFFPSTKMFISFFKLLYLRWSPYMLQQQYCSEGREIC